MLRIHISSFTNYKTKILVLSISNGHLKLCQNENLHTDVLHLTKSYGEVMSTDLRSKSKNK